MFNNHSLTLSLGESAAALLTVTSPSSAPVGFYSVVVRGTNATTPPISASCSATCSIMNSLADSASSAQVSYTRSQTASVTAVACSNGSPISGAGVSFTMTKPNGAVVTGTGTTAADSSAVFSYRFNQKRDAEACIRSRQVLISTASLETVGPVLSCSRGWQSSSLLRPRSRRSKRQLQ